MKQYGLSIDPGMSTGICLFSWDDPDYIDGAFRQERLWQFVGGADFLARWLENFAKLSPDAIGFPVMEYAGLPVIISALVVEKFTPRPHETFSLTQKAVEPLRGEGVLIGRGLLPYIRWREPSQQYFMGGSDLADKKKRSRDFLKLNGLYVTGKNVDAPDADDAISAQLHAIAFLRNIRHMPTINEFFGEES